MDLFGWFLIFLWLINLVAAGWLAWMLIYKIKEDDVKEKEFINKRIDELIAEVESYRNWLDDCSDNH